MAPCQPLCEKEEGHCDKQVESPICGRGNTAMEAKLGGNTGMEAKLSGNTGMEAKLGGNTGMEAK